MTYNFQVDRVTVEHINRVADVMASDINYGSKETKKVLDQIKEDFSPEFAMWVMDKAKALVF
ncbi:hypothetical protein [Halobacillus sp. H74]|uniref:hypothetical protein n=1 Tax=Halobacillus sp. H74 TaxID=3457436 RepID=UPI003FCD6C2D